MSTVIPKKRLSLAQIFNMSFGFFGIQFGFALQNGNASTILTSFGADVENLSWFWLAAPLTGMIVQPIIGYFSDRTWTALGRRKPYFLAGSILAAGALIFMPNAAVLAYILPPLYVGAGILMIMDASFNVAMEPFRALVADLLPSDQRTLGFSIQTALIGLGAVIGSWLPIIFTKFFPIQTLNKGEIGDNVTISFYVGAAVFLLAIIWTVVTTTEFPPEEYEKEPSQIGQKKGIAQIVSDFAGMPKTMKQLGVVQFFSWFALFSMWVFTSRAIATHVYGLPLEDTTSEAYQLAGNKTNFLFGVYNGVSAIWAFALPVIAAKVGRKLTYSISLIAGGLGLISIYFVHDPTSLTYSMVGVGMAWASILAMPYAILAGSINPLKMGIYMGIFNFFITFPQIVSSLAAGPIVKRLFNSQPIYIIVMAGVFLIIAAISVRFVEDKDDPINVK